MNTEWFVAGLERITCNSKDIISPGGRKRTSAFLVRNILQNSNIEVFHCKNMSAEITLVAIKNTSFLKKIQHLRSINNSASRWIHRCMKSDIVTGRIEISADSPFSILWTNPGYGYYRKRAPPLLHVHAH